MGSRRLVAFLAFAFIMACLFLLTVRGSAWARPNQDPLRQTVPTPTPSFTPVPTPSPTPTAVPPPPTATPVPPTLTPSLTPTAAPFSPTPTATSVAPPPPTPTAVPPSPTSTVTPVPPPPPRPTNTPLPSATPIPPVASLAVHKEANPQAVLPGDEVAFTIVVANRGGRKASKVRLMDAVEDYLVVEKVEVEKGKAVVKGNRVIVELDALAPAEEVSVVIRARVREGVEAGVIIHNRAEVIFEGSRKASGVVSIALPPAELPGCTY